MCCWINSWRGAHVHVPMTPRLHVFVRLNAKFAPTSTCSLHSFTCVVREQGVPAHVRAASLFLHVLLEHKWARVRARWLAGMRPAACAACACTLGRLAFANTNGSRLRPRQSGSRSEGIMCHCIIFICCTSIVCGRARVGCACVLLKHAKALLTPTRPWHPCAYVAMQNAKMVSAFARSRHDIAFVVGYRVGDGARVSASGNATHHAHSARSHCVRVHVCAISIVRLLRLHSFVFAGSALGVGAHVSAAPACL